MIEITVSEPSMFVIAIVHICFAWEHDAIYCVRFLPHAFIEEFI